MYLHEDGRANFRLLQALEEMLGNRMHNGLELLRDHVDTTCGYHPLTLALGSSRQALMGMLNPAGNPKSRNVFGIMAELQRLQGCVITARLVRAHPGARQTSESDEQRASTLGHLTDPAARNYVSAPRLPRQNFGLLALERAAQVR